MYTNPSPPSPATAEMMAAMMTPPRSAEMRMSQYKHMTPKQIRTDKARKNSSPKRNTPCPCGSGLKFKKCCIHKERLVS